MSSNIDPIESMPLPVTAHPAHDVRPPAAGATNPIASVTSQPRPQPGQKGRSSGNFSTQDAPADTRKLQWFVTENDNFREISFNVLKDKKLWPDSAVFENVKNGDVTDYVSERQLYIADPEGAGIKTFIVQVWPYPNT